MGKDTKTGSTKLFEFVRFNSVCLSDDIAEQVSGIRTGDLVGLNGRH